VDLGSAIDSDSTTDHDRRPHLWAASLGPPDTGFSRRNLRTHVEVGDDAIVVRLTGRLDVPSSSQLWSLLGNLPLDRPWLVLDLAGVPEIERGALAVLAAAPQRLGHGRRLALWRVRAQPLALLRENELQRVVEIVSGPLETWLARRRPLPPHEGPSVAGGLPPGPPRPRPTTLPTPQVAWGTG
jgi:hypothetical protein